MGNEHDFSTTILNKYSIKSLQVSVVLFSTSQNLSLSILILQLNMMADRGLEKLASRSALGNWAVMAGGRRFTRPLIPKQRMIT